MSGMLTRAGLRAFSTKGLQVVNDVAKQQFVVSMNNATAVLGYENQDKHITFVRTDVPKEFQGKGVGKLLAQFAFDHAVKNKFEVTCKCHFLAKFYNDNKQKYNTLKIKFDLD